MATLAMSQRFDPFVATMRSDPYPIYHHFRAHEPVHWGIPLYPDVSGIWYLFRHADCVALLSDPRFGRELARIAPDTAMAQQAGKSMLFSDPPDHTRLRSLVNKAFTPRMVERLAPRIGAITTELLDAVQPIGQMDVIADLAFPLPVSVIAEMMGVPAQDRALLKRWSYALTRAIDARREEDLERINQAATEAGMEFAAYLWQLIEVRRRDPQNDLLSALIAAEAQGDKLNAAELIRMCVLLLAAGHETTVNLIGNGLLALMRHPDQMDLLKQQPELIESAVDELLRFDAPVQSTGRIVFEDVVIGGKQIRKGERVTALLGAANRDPSVFADPDRLDIRRNDRRYLSFGHGIHYCLGAPLARLEAQIAFNAVLRRMPNIHLQTEELTWREGFGFHGVISLPVAF
jgi:cytochrome P450 StaP